MMAITGIPGGGDFHLFAEGNRVLCHTILFANTFCRG